MWSIVRESQLLSWTVGGVVTIVVLLLASALVSGRRGRRETGSVRREPVLHHGHPDRGDQDPSYDLQRERRSAADPRRRFGTAALTLSFLGGLVVGAGGLALSSTGQFGSAVRALVGVIAAGSSDARETPGLPDVAQAADETKALTAPPVPAAPALVAANPPPADLAGEVKNRLALFAGGLKASLPKEAGPEITLTGVEATEMTLSLGYTVARVMPEDEIAKFDAFIMKSIKALFCGKEAREIRFLNESGVAVHMVYADPRGETVAKLTVPPHFCA